MESKNYYAYRRDIPFDFELDNNGDLKMLQDLEAVNQSLYNIIVSNKNSKQFEESFGANVDSILFENVQADSFLLHEVKTNIIEAIRKDEPNISILDVSIDMTNITENIIRIVIPYKLNDGITTGTFDENISLEVLI